MDYDKLAALALAFPILAAVTTPGVAQACPGGYYDPCEGINFWQDLTAVNAAKIPSDGVLVLQGNHQGDDAASLPSIELNRDERWATARRRARGDLAARGAGVAAERAMGGRHHLCDVRDHHQSS